MMTENEYTDTVVETMNKIGKKVEQGEKQGLIKCPFCGGNIEYIYENCMAMRAKCDTCEFKSFA